MGPAGAGLRMRRPAARGALRYSPWGRAAELSSLAALVALEQLRRVSLRSARVRAPTPGLRSSPSHTQPGAARPHALRGRSVLGGECLASSGASSPAACRAPQARSPGASRARCPARVLLQQRTAVPRQAVGGCALARLCGGEEASPDTNSPVDCSCLASGWSLAPSAACKARVSVGARTRALRQLTHRICSSETNAVSEASYAVRPKPEHRSAVGAPLAPTAAVARQRASARSLAPASTSSTLRTASRSPMEKLT